MKNTEWEFHVNDTVIRKLNREQYYRLYSWLRQVKRVIIERSKAKECKHRFVKYNFRSKEVVCADCGEVQSKFVVGEVGNGKYKL